MRWPLVLNSPSGGFYLQRQRSGTLSAVALVAYAWLVFQAVLPLVQSWRDAHRDKETALAASRIEMPAEQVRHCMHHTEMACPPNCHCPPEVVESHGHHEADSEAKADLLKGETCYRACSSEADFAWEMGGLPLHALCLTEAPMLWESQAAQYEIASSRWAGFSPEAPDKVPIFLA